MNTNEFEVTEPNAFEIQFQMTPKDMQRKNLEFHAKELFLHEVLTMSEYFQICNKIKYLIEK